MGVDSPARRARVGLLVAAVLTATALLPASSAAIGSFVAGTVGPPGQRTFFLQASRGTQLVSVVIEKAQVAVLAERLADLVVDRGFESFID